MPGSYRLSGYAHWYNLDLPETIAVRQKLLPERGEISQIAMSAMEDRGDLVAEQGAPALVIIEGLTMYLSEADFAALAGKILLILPDQDFFSGKMQQGLIRLMHDPQITYVSGGHLSTVLKAESYMSTIRTFLQSLDA